MAVKEFRGRTIYGLNAIYINETIPTVWEGKPPCLNAYNIKGNVLILLYNFYWRPYLQVLLLVVIYLTILSGRASMIAHFKNNYFLMPEFLYFGIRAKTYFFMLVDSIFCED